MQLKYGPYSPSRLDTGICGYAFKNQYVDKNVKQFASLAQDRGSAVHEVFEKVTAKLIKDPNAYFAPNEVRQWVAEAINNNPASVMETNEVLEMVNLYIRRPPPEPLPSDAGIELRLAVKICGFAGDGSPLFDECDYNDPKAFARGRADILMISDDKVNPIAIIYDHKTQPNIENADTFQMGFYAWVIKKHYPFLKEVRTILHFARYGVYSHPYVWDEKALAEIEDEVVTRVMAIEGNNTWQAVPHDKCQYCLLMATCPVWKDAINVNPETGHVVGVKHDSFKILGNTHKAVQVAGLLNVLEEAVSVCKEELKSFVKDGFSIAIHGKVYEFRKAETGIHWDMVNKKMRDQMYAIFEKYKVDPKRYMGFSKTFSNPVFDEMDPALVQELSKMLPRQEKTEFKGWKS